LWATKEQPSADAIQIKLASPNQERIWYIRYALKSGMTNEAIFGITGIDPWFISQIAELCRMEEELKSLGSLASVQ
jgi:carbamoyl-phosphate synthase large subunit